MRRSRGGRRGGRRAAACDYNLNFGASDLALYKRIPQNSTPFYDHHFKNTKHSWTHENTAAVARHNILSKISIET